MKGYIARDHGMVVLSKAGAFPGTGVWTRPGGVRSQFTFIRSRERTQKSRFNEHSQLSRMFHLRLKAHPTDPCFSSARGIDNIPAAAALQRSQDKSIAQLKRIRSFWMVDCGLLNLADQILYHWSGRE